ncbi:MAG: biotin transporter BioY [Archaeoglobaceae archaeon]
MVNYLRFALAIAMAALTALSAQVSFKIGVVPYTMQNFGVMLSAFLLGRYAAVAMLIYVGMIAVGLPVASGGGGIAVLFGPTSGYIYGFVVAAYLAGLLKERVSGSAVKLWIVAAVASVPIYAMGFAVLYAYTSLDPNVLQRLEVFASKLGFDVSGPLLVFLTGVAIFVPQDLFVDHVAAVAAYLYIRRLLVERGIELDKR